MMKSKKISGLFVIVCLLTSLSGCLIMERQKLKKLTQILNSGNDALRAKQFDKAIEHYDNGLTLRPKEPAFLTNKSIALRLRGIDRFNAAIRITDEKAKADAINTAENDFIKASDTANESVEQVKTASLTNFHILDSPDSIKLGAFAARADAMRILAVIVDKTKTPQALEAAREYFSLETNEERKLKEQLETGKMLVDTNNGAQALIEYQNILNVNPDQLEANFGMALALAQSGKVYDLRKAKPYLEKFVEQAPADNKSVPIAKEILNSIPTEKFRN